MDARAVIIGFIWLAVMVIAASYIFVGGVYWGTDIAVALLVVIAFVMTLIVGFGLEYFQTKMDKERPSTKTLAQMSTELTEIKLVVNDLAKNIDAIQKELQE
jgi:sensor histidine kinase YesM